MGGHCWLPSSWWTVMVDWDLKCFEVLCSEKFQVIVCTHQQKERRNRHTIPLSFFGMLLLLLLSTMAMTGEHPPYHANTTNNTLTFSAVDDIHPTLSVIDGDNAWPPHPQYQWHSSHDDDVPITHSHQQNENGDGPEIMEVIGRDKETVRDKETKWWVVPTQLLSTISHLQVSPCTHASSSSCMHAHHTVRLGTAVHFFGVPIALTMFIV